jgi:hypothetical protein
LNYDVETLLDESLDAHGPGPGGKKTRLAELV